MYIGQIDIAIGAISLSPTVNTCCLLERSAILLQQLWLNYVFYLILLLSKLA